MDAKFSASISRVFLKLSEAERIAAGAMAAAGFIPIVGWAGRAVKGGSAIYKTAKGFNAAENALDAYKSSKGLDVLKQTEYGLYGLTAANGLGEAVTGRDMFGNELTEEQRQNSLMNALGIAGVAGAAKVADKTKFIPYSKEYLQNKVQKAQGTIKDMGKVLGKVEVPTGVKVRTVADTTGNTYKSIGVDRATIKDLAQKITAKGEGSKGTGNGKHLDDVPRIKEVEVSFKRNDKHDSEEFARQLKDQEKGMNELTVDEYLKNREKYIEQGRAIEGNAAQQATREKALNKKIEELFESGMSWEEAEIKANSWLKTQAALHNPDQIAGGNPLNIGGMGDKRINSSIGSQWKYRIDIVDDQIGELAKLMTPEQRKSTYLNVKLTH